MVIFPVKRNRQIKNSTPLIYLNDKMNEKSVRWSFNKKKTKVDKQKMLLKQSFNHQFSNKFKE